ncbi:MAG: FlgD immunoglobulin-like domain containing protein, partial [Gemmatimonadota bacterium]|nr:FlgD immunoglobulin-like domain containing protein [Gemmatimonadota bacterium]
KTAGFQENEGYCDFNEDGSINISDVISLLLYQRDNPGDLKADFNQDGGADISDAIALLLAQRDGTCPDAGVLLSRANKTAGILNLTAEEIAYLEKIKAGLNLTEEEEAAFRTALYGNAGKEKLPKAFSLAQNAPNPFNPATTISYTVPEGSTGQVTLTVYDTRGRLVRTLVSESREAGAYSVFWDGTDEGGRRVASGLYFYRMRAGDFSKIRKMVLLK